MQNATFGENEGKNKKKKDSIINEVKNENKSGIEHKVVRLNISQFELTKALYTSELFAKQELTSSAKLFLWALCTHYNPNNETMFPAQTTVAKKLGISAKSAQRAVKELKTAGLIEYVTRGVNHYSFSLKFFEAVKMSVKVGQNVCSDAGQNVRLTNNHEKKKNNSDFSFKKGFLKSGQSEQKQRDNGVPSKRMYANAEETRKLIKEREKIREEGFNPYDYNKKDAYDWLKSIPAFWLYKSHLAKTLVEKYRFDEFLDILTCNKSEGSD